MAKSFDVQYRNTWFCEVPVINEYTMQLTSVPKHFHSLHPSSSVSKVSQNSSSLPFWIVDSVLGLQTHESTSRLSCHERLCLSVPGQHTAAPPADFTVCELLSQNFQASNQRKTPQTFFGCHRLVIGSKGSGSQRECCSVYSPRSRALQHLNKICAN